MKRNTKMNFSTLFRAATLVLVLVALTTAPCLAADVYLVAKEYDLTLPGGAQVKMWGYALDADSNLATDGGEMPSSPGPAIVVPFNDSTLNIHLRNDLSQDTSLMIAGQAMPVATGVAPVMDAGTVTPYGSTAPRVLSFTAQATAGGGTNTYSWASIKPGTYLYQSATHPAVQVQMGLYGAMIQDAADLNVAYTGMLPYVNQVTLFYSEIDPVAHDAIAGTADGLTAATYGTAAYSSTIGYNAQYFLINGEPYDAVGSQDYMIVASERTLLRFLSASLSTHVPTLGGGLYMSVVAEDGNALTSPRELYSDRLAAGRTLDAIVTPSSGRYAIYDHAMGVTNGSAATPGGMIAFLVAP